MTILCMTGLMNAQPRPADKIAPDPATTPDTYEARYEGGVFGASGKETGTLRFDDANQRLGLCTARREGDVFNPVRRAIDGVSRFQRQCSANRKGHCSSECSLFAISQLC